MRRRYRAIAIVSLVAFLLVVNAPVFAGVISHVSGTGNNKVASSNLYKTTADPLVYQQATNFNRAYTSQSNFATSYDNFSVGATTTITEVAWIGSYFNPNVQTTQWTLKFYADNGGAPAATLATYTDACPIVCNEMFLQNDNVGDPTYLDMFNGTAFVANAGTQYWLSLVNDLPASYPPVWGWETADPTDGTAYNCFLGACNAIPSDLAFALWGHTQTTTPEPGSLILLGTGVLGLAGSLRRKLF